MTFNLTQLLFLAILCTVLCTACVPLLVIVCCYCYSGRGMADPSDDKFTVAGGDADFGSRAKNIFAGLESLEARHIAVESSEAAQRESHSLMKPDPTDDFFSAPSGPSEPANFQVPARPPPKRIHSSPRPGYEKNPSKWQRYDLSDVSDNQLTERSNQKAAMDFLNQFKVHSDDATEEIDSASDTKHVFRKPDKKPESSKDAAKRPVDVKDHNVEDEEDIDENEDVTRTQVLSFADDEPLGDGRQSLDNKTQFRRRRVKQTGDRKVRSQTADDDEEEDVTHTVKTDSETSDGKELTSTANISQRTSDSESASDDFDELGEMGSDSEQEEEESSDTKSHHCHDNSASDGEKYVPEDVDLESID